MSRAVFVTIYAVVDRLRTLAIVAIFAFIVGVGAVQIFMRYTPGINPMSWVDEIMRYLNIWLVLLASSVGVKYGTHLRMEYLLQKLLPQTAVKLAHYFTALVIIVSLCILTYHGAVRTMANLRTIIHSFPISISWFYAAIPVGGVLMLLEYLLILIYGKHPFAAADAGVLTPEL